MSDVDEVLAWLRSSPRSVIRAYDGRDDGDGFLAAAEVIEELRARLDALLAPSRVLLAPSRVLRDHEPPAEQVPEVDLVAMRAVLTIEDAFGRSPSVKLRRHEDGRLSITVRSATMILTVAQIAEVVNWLVEP